jgi:hypothetical protein
MEQPVEDVIVPSADAPFSLLLGSVPGVWPGRTS